MDSWSNHHPFNFSAHRYASTNDSYCSTPLYKHLFFLLCWILIRHKLLSLLQNSWKRRFFILSKSSKGNYILKYLKGQNIKGSIAVDQYVTQMQHFYLRVMYQHSLMATDWLYRHLLPMEVLDPNPTQLQKIRPWAAHRAWEVCKWTYWMPLVKFDTFTWVIVVMWYLQNRQLSSVVSKAVFLE